MAAANIYLRCRHHHAHIIDSDIEHLSLLLQLMLGFYATRISLAIQHAQWEPHLLTPVAEITQGIFIGNHLIVHTAQAQQ